MKKITLGEIRMYPKLDDCPKTITKSHKWSKNGKKCVLCGMVDDR